MSERDYYLLMMGASILLPLIPAFILFWAIPSDASVSGPFKGMTVKLGGAFAGYFVLFMLVQVYFPATGFQRYQVWHVKGNYVLEGPSDKLLDTDVSVMPSGVIVRGNSFTLDIPVDSDEGGNPNFPILQINHAPCHGSSSMDLNLKEITGFGGTSTTVQIQKSEKTHDVRIDGIHLPLDTHANRPDGTKCKS